MVARLSRVPKVPGGGSLARRLSAHRLGSGDALGSEGTCVPEPDPQPEQGPGSATASHDPSLKGAGRESSVYAAGHLTRQPAGG